MAPLGLDGSHRHALNHKLSKMLLILFFSYITHWCKLFICFLHNPLSDLFKLLISKASSTRTDSEKRQYLFPRICSQVFGFSFSHLYFPFLIHPIDFFISKFLLAYYDLLSGAFGVAMVSEKFAYRHPI